MGDGLVVEFFGCAGGMAEGFRRAGIDFTHVFDWSEDACVSYEHNLGHRPIRMDVRDLQRLWSPGKVELLVADPPCTPWSRAGSRKGLDDDRDMLRETIEIIRDWRPRSWLVANVPGLDDTGNWPSVQSVIGGLAPDWCVDFVRLNAADYGVPQKRIRPFWFGHPAGTPCIQWPRPTHCENPQPTLPGIESLKPWVTCKQALGHLPPELIGHPVRSRIRRSDHPASRADEPALTISTGASRHQSNTIVTDWPWDRPATTVCADPRIPPPGHHSNNSYMSQGIAISEQAAAILQGFPEGWLFSGKTKKARWSQIGMAMPPPLAFHVATSIARWAKEHPYAWVA